MKNIVFKKISMSGNLISCLDEQGSVWVCELLRDSNNQYRMRDGNWIKLESPEVEENPRSGADNVFPKFFQDGEEA